MITFQLDPKSGVPIYRQIQDLIRFGIASAKLVPGEQLPTVRALAVELAVNPNTVIKAYGELEQQGLLTTEQGSGTFIAALANPISTDQRRSKLDVLCREFLAQASRYGFRTDEVLGALKAITRRAAP
jgi:GntR family transcriptional regulator